MKMKNRYLFGNDSLIGVDELPSQRVATDKSFNVVMEEVEAVYVA